MSSSPVNSVRKSGKAGAPARSSARLAAVQGLYQMDIAGTGIERVIGERLSYGLGTDQASQGAPDERVAGAEDASLPASEDVQELVAPDPVLFAEILRGVMRRQWDIDPAVDEQLAKGWRLVRIDSTVRAILRAGTFELIERSDVPARVVISEYVQIAHAFFSGDEPKVVNGVLDSLARKYRASEFEGRAD